MASHSDTEEKRAPILREDDRERHASSESGLRVGRKAKPSSLLRTASKSKQQNGEQGSGPLAGNGGPGLLRADTAPALQPFAAESEEHGVQKTAEDHVRKSFQIPKKNKEKKELCQLVPVDSREFKQDILKILNSSCLDTSSSANFTYVKASMIHNERLEKEYMEKRKELRSEGRTEKELTESYAFLLLDTSQIPIICERGLPVGHSKVTILGNPTMGVYLSKYCDILQPNPLDSGRKAEMMIFKIIKGRVKAVFDNSTKNFTPPTPKHDCHVFRNLNRVTSLFTYRAFDLTQFYLYEFGNEGIRQYPRHVCPYAVVSFVYKEKIPKIPKPVVFSIDDTQSGKPYTIWKGQLMNKGRFLCFGILRSATQPFLPFKLPEKLDIETVMSVDCLKNKVPITVFRKITFLGTREALKNGLYYSLYEFVEQGKAGSNLESLLHKLEEEKLVLIKPLGDRGFLLLFSPLEMADNESQSSKPKFLQALFLFPESRLIGIDEIKRNAQSVSTVCNDPEVMLQLSKLVPALHFALDKIRKELPCSLKNSTIDTAFENNLIGYLKNSQGKVACAENGNPNQFVIPSYEEKKFSSTRQKRSNLSRILRSYFFHPLRYQFEVSKAVEMLNQYPVSETELLSSPATCFGEEQKFENPMPEVAVQEPLDPDGNFVMPSDNMADYDPDKIQELIDLIYSRKRYGPGETTIMNIEGLTHCISDKNNLGIKRKLESVTERSSKHMKTAQGSLAVDESRLSETDQVTNGLGFNESDLRQCEPTTTLAPDTEKLVGLLLDIFKSSNCQSTGSEVPLNQDARMPVCSSGSDLQSKNLDYCWDQSNSFTNEKQLNQKNIGHMPHAEAANQEHSQEAFIPVFERESSRLCESGSGLAYVDDIHFRIKMKDQLSEEHSQQYNLRAEHPEEQSIGSIGSAESCSPCTNASLEQLYSKKVTTSDCASDSEINWKLIPITDMKSRIEQLFYLPPEDSCPEDPRVINRQSNISHQSPSDSDAGASNVLKDFQPDFAAYETNGHSFDLKGDSASAIENAVLSEYSIFSDKMKQLLKKEKVCYGSDNKKPIFLSPRKVPALSKYSNVQSHQVSVQSYVNKLRKRMNSVIADACADLPCTKLNLLPSSSPELAQRMQKENVNCKRVIQELLPSTGSQLNTSVCTTEESVHCKNSIYEEVIPCEKIQGPEKDPKTGVSLSESAVQPQTPGHTSSVDDSNYIAAVGEDKRLSPEKTPSLGNQQEMVHSAQEPSGTVGLPGTQPCLTNLIQQLNPEVFCSLVEIIKDVQKNTVKFYIYEVEKTSVCAEIKEYLTGLGNKECHPEEFLKKKDGSMDKLLIIIQNEDIASHIHKVPSLISLKKLSRVSFAGVDSLDDVQNHTYNELFVSGGFMVSDETVLNPECVTVENLQIFLDFLKDLSTPDSKWVWKVHCKMHKKLKELARTNTAAFNILSLLNKYQKCNLVEVLSYHDCDSRSRNTIELDCLVKLQAQTIQHRHAVFLTEKNMEPLFNYSEYGVVVASIADLVKNFKNLIGYHSSSMEDKQLLGLGSQDGLQGTFSSNSLELAEVGNIDTKNLERSEGNNEEEDMSLDSEDNSPQIEICSEKSEDVNANSPQTEVQGTKDLLIHSEESSQQASGDVQITTSVDLTSELASNDIPTSTLQLVKGDKDSKRVEGFAYNSTPFYSHSNVESDYRNFNVITHQSFLTSGFGQSYMPPFNQNSQDSSGYFSSEYNQNLPYKNNWKSSWNAGGAPNLSYQKQQQKQHQQRYH
ncbi:protein TASOR isoform X2 [Stegostoma tigrinum]|uniref:protein TASOR isoform X2 n=1 Tax=Stegostoma tigrinum TaxID=3053191 RepID=UPI0028707ECC|nr:protein TASOR isoform X2 [Stegostoma tigrinum]